MSNLQREWWKEVVIYQIYPASFCDSNGDGVGDLNGIYSKLDYLESLGVDILWLSPIYRSPQKDMGYDISDYRDIDPQYGTLADWDRLVKGMHDRGLKMMMDLVVNHTSDMHQWFIDSRSSKDNPKRDWYIWRPAKYDANGTRHPPNNWKAAFQGSVWEWDEATQEYYLHLYLPGQPDLNWENPAVRNAIWDLMIFWLDRGTDGFRMDAISLISKVEGLPDAPIAYPDEQYQPATMHYANGPHVHDYLKEMNEKVLSKYTVLSVGQASGSINMQALAAYTLPARKELNMMFQFELMHIEKFGASRAGAIRKWTLMDFKEIITRWQTFQREDGFWNSVFIESHDHPRSVSRFGNMSTAQWRVRSAKMLAMLQIAQSGTLYVYQGEEIAMANIPKSWGIEEYKDVATQNYYARMLRMRRESGNDNSMSDILDGFQWKARDNARTPVQWNREKHAGFTTGTPWMRVNDDYETWNVAAQVDDPCSVWSFWKRALAIRKVHDVLIYGAFKLIDEHNEAVFAFTQSLDAKLALVILNFTGREVLFEVPASDAAFSQGASLLLSNYSKEESGEAEIGIFERSLALKGYEGRIYIGL